jgi:hypothetical protein
MTSYPNREHANADKSARRRAATALDGIEAETSMLRRLLRGESVEPDGDDTQLITQHVRALVQQMSVLGALREVREWDAADIAEAAEDAR